VSTPSLFPWVAVALCVHGAAFAASDRRAAAASSHAPPLEVELGAVDPEPPPAPTAPAPPEEDRPSEPAPARPAKIAPRPAATSAPPVAAAAKVGALLTSGETADSADPVAFFSDPSGGVYGSGVVARGGQAEHGAGPPVAAAGALRSGGPGRAESVTPVADLSRAPTLDEPDACRGFFPADAAVDTAKVDLVVVVQTGGRVSSATIARESPAGEGFGRAARACLLSKRFTPGADKGGRPVTASAAVRVHFTR
jgi:outer membrane biosynthesis protein TonB